MFECKESLSNNSVPLQVVARSIFLGHHLDLVSLVAVYGVALKSSLTYLVITQGIHCGRPPVPAQAAHGAESKRTAPNQLQYAQYVFKPTDTTRKTVKLRVPVQIGLRYRLW